MFYVNTLDIGIVDVGILRLRVSGVVAKPCNHKELNAVLKYVCNLEDNDDDPDIDFDELEG